jgi:hypothetical protein
MKTNLHTVLCIAIRLGAVLLAVHALEDAGTMIAVEENRHRLVGVLLFDALYLAVGVVLWLWPGMLAWWASSRSSRQMLETPIAADDLQRIALSVLGVWLMVSGLSGFLSHALIMVFLGERLTSYTTGHLPASEWRGLFYYGLEAIGGAVVALGATGLVSLFHRLRRFPGASAAASAADANEAGSG